MPRVSREFRYYVRKQTIAGLLATVGVAAVSTVAIQAQENGGLRGAVDQNSTGAIAQQQPKTTVQPPAYVPASPGAVPDEPDPDQPEAKPANSIFGDVADPTPTPDDQSLDRTTSKPTTGRRAKLAAKDAKKVDPKAPQKEAAITAPARLLDDQTTATTRVKAQDRTKKIDLSDEAGRAEAIDSHDKIGEDDPFQPLGMRVGSFILRPSIEQGLTATSNANYSVNGESALLSETTLRLNAISDWSRHSATLDAYGNFRESVDGYDLSETRAGIDAALNLDLANEMRASGTLTYERTPETASSPVEIVGTAEQPIRQTFGGTLGLEKDVGKARYGVTALIEHDDYGDANLTDGSVLSQSDRNSTLATVTIRGGYEISPALTPFLEAELGKRIYDQSVDSSGYARDSDRYGLRGGVEVDLNEKVVGEVSAGYIHEDFEDDRLRAIDGPSLNASLTWSPERETSVRLDASTTVEGATDPGESGSILHSGRVTIERKIRANLTANAILGVGYRDYSGLGEHDLLLSAEVGSTWWLNRYTGITGRLRHEEQRSDPATRNYEADSVFLGLKVQK